MCVCVCVVVVLTFMSRCDKGMNRRHTCTKEMFYTCSQTMCASTTNTNQQSINTLMAARRVHQKHEHVITVYIVCMQVYIYLWSALVLFAKRSFLMGKFCLCENSDTRWKLSTSLKIPTNRHTMHTLAQWAMCVCVCVWTSAFVCVAATAAVTKARETVRKEMESNWQSRHWFRNLNRTIHQQKWVQFACNGPAYSL